MKKLLEKIKGMKKSTLAAIGGSAVVVVIAVVVGIVLLAKGGKLGSGGGSENVGNGKNQTYTVTLKTQGGMALAGKDVYIYADDSCSDMKKFATTDEKGTVTFNLPESKKYAIVLSGLPKGYQTEKTYAFSGTQADITVTSALVEDADIMGTTLGVGDVMYDMTVKTSDGKELKLSEVLKTKKMLLINFWYTTCQYCVLEFPYMQEAYDKYKDDIEIVALNHLEDDKAIENFKSSMNLTFPMAQCAGTMPQSVFGVSGWPTSVFVDRYGVICLVEAGGITSLSPFVSAFDHFTANDYKQNLYESIGAMVERVKPNVTMPDSDAIAAAINGSGVTASYRPETKDSEAEYIWPFVLGEKDGSKCIYASNKSVDDSYAIIYADVDVKKGQAIGFDYYSSCEAGSDGLFVIVNGDDIYQISGVGNEWEKCYAWVAEEDGTCEVAFCYGKDGSGSAGDDTIYIRDLRTVDASAVDKVTYIPRNAAVTSNGFEYKYANIVYSEKDGYYHVDSENGPLLLADLLGYTQFDEEKSVYQNILDNEYKINGVKLEDEIVKYCSYASNSQLANVCTVNKELAELLKKFMSVAGFEDDPNEWLRVCKYYQAYGTNGVQLDDPIRGLSPTSAYEAKLGKDVASNQFYYDRVIMPRGLLAKFVPEKSGAYRITSKSETQQGTEAWIYNNKAEIIYTYEHAERMYEDDLNVSMVYYMEAGKEYFIDIAFWDLYEVGTIKYDIEYLGSSYELFRLASMGYFSYDGNEAANDVYYIISGGIKPVLGSDGYYYEDLGGGKQGSLIYADFTGITGVFDDSIESMIKKNGFDFSKSENDAYILSIIQEKGNDTDAAKKYLKELWGDDYDFYAGEYKLDDVFAGRYHGKGENCTEKISKYLDKMDQSGKSERKGCVPVDKELAEILQMLMEKYTFENVENAWLKMCYYYQSISK